MPDSLRAFINLPSIINRPPSILILIIIITDQVCASIFCARPLHRNKNIRRTQPTHKPVKSSFLWVEAAASSTGTCATAKHQHHHQSVIKRTEHSIIHHPAGRSYLLVTCILYHCNHKDISSRQTNQRPITTMSRHFHFSLQISSISWPLPVCAAAWC